MSGEFNEPSVNPGGRVSIWFFVPFICTALIIGVIWVKLDRAPGTPKAVSEPVKMVVENTVARELMLFFPSVSDRGWAPEQRDIQSLDSERHEIRQCILELIEGPRHGGHRIFPSDVDLRDVFLDSRGMLIVDLAYSGRVIPFGGVQSEERCIQAVEKTIVANFSMVKSYQFLINGRELTTLGGHIDVSKPFLILHSEATSETR